MTRRHAVRSTAYSRRGCRAGASEGIPRTCAQPTPDMRDERRMAGTAPSEHLLGGLGEYPPRNGSCPQSFHNNLSHIRPRRPHSGRRGRSWCRRRRPCDPCTVADPVPERIIIANWNARIASIVVLLLLSAASLGGIHDPPDRSAKGALWPGALFVAIPMMLALRGLTVGVVVVGD